MTTSRPSLPAGFLFGASTASYQIEGAVTEDGRGRSIWDTFTAEPGRIVDGSSGAVTCDHYHRWPEDVALMRRLGLDGYRFSIAWPRIQPTGSGPANQAGLDFYDRLVDGLLDAGISPMATLYHWDLPQVLEDGGGWLNRDTASRFGEYAAIMGDLLGDRVTHWCPVNDPNVATLNGYGEGTLAPGRSLVYGALPVAHHLLLGHGLAVRALRAAGAHQVGTATNHLPVWPLSDAEADQSAAAQLDVLWNRLFADPVLLGRYPEGLGELMPGPVAEDLATISQPLDFYGLNYYNPQGVRAAAEGAPLPFGADTVPGYPTTDFGWPVVPEGLTELLTAFRDRYGDRLPPVTITENGCSYEGLDDQDRIAYLDGHVRALHEAMEAGVDVRGYFVWSLLDNFEWAEGYARRFGLVHVDFATLERTPKASYHWLRDALRAQRG